MHSTNTYGVLVILLACRGLWTQWRVEAFISLTALSVSPSNPSGWKTWKVRYVGFLDFGDFSSGSYSGQRPDKALAGPGSLKGFFT